MSNAPPTSPGPEESNRRTVLSDYWQSSMLFRYWRMNLIIMGVLLGVWALAGLGAGVLFADWLNRFRVPGTGFPLGFWFAHQGSILVFVLLILVYCLLMNRLDRDHHDEARRLADRGKR